MGEAADALRDDIESRRRAMTNDVNELEQRAKSMADWRQQVNDRPMVAIGVAAAGGMILGLLTGGSNDSESDSSRDRQAMYSYSPQYRGQRQQDEHRQNGGGSGMSGWVTGEKGPSQATQVGKERAASKVDEIRGALMGLAASKAEEFLKEALPGFKDEVDKVQQKGESKASGRTEQTPQTVDGSGSSTAAFQKPHPTV